MTRETVLYILALLVTTFAIGGLLAVYNEPDIYTISSATGTPIDHSLFQYEVRPGLTIMGDSYSADHPNAWHNFLSQKPVQNVAQQGASLDDNFAHFEMSAQEYAELPPDLLGQAKNLLYWTEEMVIWFGINDLMTLHTWPFPRQKRAIENELITLFQFVDMVVDAGVKHVIVPNVLDFAQSPGLYLARTVNNTVPLKETTRTIKEWNSRLAVGVAKRDKVSSIDMYKLSQEWMRNPKSVGLASLLRTESGEPALWHDFLHMTAWVHEHLFAPLFESALF